MRFEWAQSSPVYIDSTLFFVSLSDLCAFCGKTRFTPSCESMRTASIDLRSGDLTVASSAWASAEEEGQ